jgi:hypothetical protein
MTHLAEMRHIEAPGPAVPLVALVMLLGFRLP